LYVTASMQYGNSSTGVTLFSKSAFSQLAQCIHITVEIVTFFRNCYLKDTLTSPVLQAACTTLRCCGV
jgi:hypothetical protein